MRPRVLIAGGYGVVGGQIARLLRAAGHDVDLVLAGRRPEAGAALAQELDAETARLDVDAPDRDLAAVGAVDLVIAALQDPGDNLLRTALTAGAAHIGIVRTADSMASSAIAATALARRPALMLGHWQAGVLTLAALASARTFEQVERVELAALYDYADPIGPMTAGDAGDFIGRALLRRDGAWLTVAAAENGRRVARNGQDPFEAMPMGVLDVPALAAVTGARDVRFDLGTGVSRGSASGGPASHELYIDLAGRLPSGRSAVRRTVVSDPRGQARLTAIGVVMGAERLLGLDGGSPLPSGLVFPEGILDPQAALDRLRGYGVQVEMEA